MAASGCHIIPAIPGQFEGMVRPVELCSNDQRAGRQAPGSFESGKMVRLSGESSNRLFEILADWNDILRSTSLNDNRTTEPVKEPSRKAETRR